MGLHYLNAFDNQTFNITFLVEVFNGYSKIFNTVMLFLRQITKDSVKKKKFYVFGRNISSQSKFCSFDDWFLEIQSKFIHVIFIQGTDSCIAVFFLDFIVASLKQTSKKWNY